MNRTWWIGAGAAVVAAFVLGYIVGGDGSSPESTPTQAQGPKSPNQVTARRMTERQVADEAARYDYAKEYNKQRQRAPERPTAKVQDWTKEREMSDSEWRTTVLGQVKDSLQKVDQEHHSAIMQISYDMVDTLSRTRQQVTTGQMTPEQFRVAVEQVQAKTEDRLREQLHDEDLVAFVSKSLTTAGPSKK